MESISLEFTETEVESSKYGDRMKYDASGPYQKIRTRTDFCWLIGFAVYLIIWSAVIIYAFSAGDTSKELKPKDSAGRTCGYDSGVESKPYLVHYNPETCQTSDCLVCQSDCPKNDFEFEYVAESNNQSKESTTTERVTAPSGDVDGEKKTAGSNGTLEEPKKLPEEKVDEEKNKAANNATSEELKKLHEEKKAGSNETLKEQQKPPEDKKEAASGKSTPDEKRGNNGGLAAQKKESSPVAMAQRADGNATDSSDARKNKFDRMIKGVICKSDVKLDLINGLEKLQYLVDHDKCSRSYRKADNAQKYGFRCGFNLTDASQPNSLNVPQALSNAKWSIMGFIMLSGTIALASILLMRWYAMAYVCTSIFVICALAFHYIYEKCVLGAESKTNGVLLALFLGVVVLVLIVLIAIYFRQQISFACQMIEESSKAITCVLSSLAVPFIFFVLYALIFILGVSVYFLLGTLESPVYRAEFADKETCTCPPNLGYEQNSTCDPVTFNSLCQIKPSGGPCALSGCYMVKQNPSGVGFLHLLNFVGLVWSFWFVSGFNDTVLASVFSTWYWTFNKKILSYLTIIESFWTIGTYHLGTIVLGSLLIVICTIIRAIFKAIERSLKRSKRPFAAAILLSLQCVVDMMERCIDFINRRAYIMCAMHGTDFFQSARTAYYLMMRNINRVVAVVTVTNCLTFITTVLIACIVTRISVSYYEGRDDLYHSPAPGIFVFVGSYAITYMLMRVIEVAVNTVFLCFLEDTERNDGTNEKPYFMSEELTKFLYKK